MQIRVGRKYEQGAHYIGRGSPLGNPFVMRDKSDAERNRVCDAYEAWLAEQVASNNPRVLGELRKLYVLAKRPQGVVLGCFCAPKRCHGDSIKRFLESFE